MNESTETSLIEIFSSIQGEGPLVGERHLFVRFQDCELSCKYCDTPLSFVENKFCRVEGPPFSRKFHPYPNPISIPALEEILQEFPEETLVITGGEPLQKAPFLKNWLAQARKRRFVLETAGVHAPELQEVIDRIDIVSMDLKLSSVTGMHPWWREHEAFLKGARRKEVTVKVVVSSEMKEEHLEKAAALVASVDPKIPFILQPASPFGHFHAVPTIDQLVHWQELARRTLPDVRVIPQVHRLMGLL